MAFLRGGAWGNMTARALRVVVDLALAFPLLAWLAVLVRARARVDVLVCVLVDVLVCVLPLVLLSLNCCAV
ncbi:hypothetical protein [Corynebacterium macclintockiae]|uniref:hypothetical protein n=1 Tax=Corynebacterium macclintockiae TaxID=2913501 RepID=UPI003EBF8182